MISTGHILTELLLELVNRRIEVSVICAQPAYYSTDRVEKKISYKGIEIIRTRNTQHNKNSVKGKLLNSTTFFIHALILAMRLNKKGSNLLVTNPPFLGIIGPILQRVTMRPFILIVHDLYPDLAVNIGYMRP